MSFVHYSVKKRNFSNLIKNEQLLKQKRSFAFKILVIEQISTFFKDPLKFKFNFIFIKIYFKNTTNLSSMFSIFIVLAVKKL